MQHRQSLGSPSSKRHGDVPLSPHDSKRLIDDDDDKPNRLSLSPSPPPNHHFIHLIPLLTLLCFLILFLSSHTPSPSDLAQFNGFKRISSHYESAAEMNNEIDKYDAKAERGGDVLAIRSLRNLREIGNGKQSNKSRAHRKFAGF